MIEQRQRAGDKEIYNLFDMKSELYGGLSIFCCAVQAMTEYWRQLVLVELLQMNLEGLLECYI